MSFTAETIRLLLLHDSQDDAEQLINALRNSGKATRAELALDEERFVAALKSGSWDLILMRPTLGEFSAMDALKHVRRLEKDFPVIVMSDQFDPAYSVSALKAGARDVVPASEREYLNLVIDRELDNLQTRKQMRELEADLRESEKRVSLLLDTSRDAVAYVTDGMHIHANDTYVSIFGYEDPDDLAGMPIMDMVIAEQHDQLKQLLRIQNQGEDATGEMEFTGLTVNGDTFKAHMSLSNATYDDEPCIQIVIRQEASAGVDESVLEEKLAEISSRDPLTGLRNRPWFLNHLDEVVKKAVKEQEYSSVLYIYLDKFRELRQQLGIKGADAVLVDLAGFLPQQLPENAELSRFGDYVFTVWLPESDLDSTAQLAENLAKSIDEHMIEADGKTAHVTASIGAAIVTENLSTGQDALSRAQEMADKLARAGGNAAQIHDPAEDQPDEADLSITDQINAALEGNGNFKLMFQPIISLRGDEEEFYEVYVRLKSGDKELQPAEFLESAANNKLINKVDRWIILNAIKTLAEHRAEGHNTKLLINLSGETAQDPSLLDWLAKAIKASKLPPASLIFQLTETDASTYLKQIQAFTEGAHQLGALTSISRFGCSLNPMKTLQHLSIDFVKLDGSFTQDLASGENKEAMQKLVEEAHELGKKTIAPFVENTQTLSNLWQLGVHYIQGYFLQAPTDSMNYDFTAE